MSKQIQDAYIVAATRTPIGRSHKGFFKHLRPDDLLAIALRSAMAQVPGLDPQAVEDVICGCAIPEAQQGLNVARIGAILAGLPNTVGGITVNRFCASGLSAVQMAADRIRVGEADVMIAAGTESMSMVPMMGNSPSLSPAIFANTDDVERYGIAYGMGLTAEKVAQQWKVSREDQDAFAVQSHARAIAAMKAGDFAAEMTPVDVTERSVNLESAEVSTSQRTVSLDEGARPDTTLEGLAKLRTVFAARGSVTAGNSSQTSDGAGALILVSEAALKRYNLKPLARFVSYASRGVPPHIMGIGPVEAIPAALKNAGLKQDDIDWFELNEAFAAQSLAVMRTLGLDPAKVNPMGGAIALGHPLGATGAIRSATVIHALQRTQKRYGMVTMCVGMGQGARPRSVTLGAQAPTELPSPRAPPFSCPFVHWGRVGMGASVPINSRSKTVRAPCPHPNPPPAGEGVNALPRAVRQWRREHPVLPQRGKGQEHACPHPCFPQRRKGAMHPQTAGLAFALCPQVVALAAWQNQLCGALRWGHLCSADLSRFRQTFGRWYPHT